VDAINLVNQHGSEGVLAAKLQEEADRFGRSASNFRLIAFDFHKQCGATSYHKCAPDAHHLRALSRLDACVLICADACGSCGASC